MSLKTTRSLVSVGIFRFRKMSELLLTLYAVIKMISKHYLTDIPMQNSG